MTIRMSSEVSNLMDIVDEQKKMIPFKEQFPTLFDNGIIRVYKNPSDEIFVKLLSNNVTLRIGDYRDGFIITASGSNIEPDRVNGLPAFRVLKRT